MNSGPVRYTAASNTPGYLPDTDEPLPTFETAREGWEHLLAEWHRWCDDADTPEPIWVVGVRVLEQRVAQGDTGTVQTATPGYDGSHDLGVSWSVGVAE